MTSLTFHEEDDFPEYLPMGSSWQQHSKNKTFPTIQDSVNQTQLPNNIHSFLSKVYQQSESPSADLEFHRKTKTKKPSKSPRSANMVLIRKRAPKPKRRPRLELPGFRWEEVAKNGHKDMPQLRTLTSNAKQSAPVIDIFEEE